MRYLIDGYNLMYAGGLLGKRLGPDGFRRVRTRFLNDLADALGPLDAFQTTVVFDAAEATGPYPDETRHKGLTVVYAVDDASADDRIEGLIAGHTAPKGLTVVSSDRRLRQAAARRKARAVPAETFWAELDARKERRSRVVSEPPPPDRPADPELSPAESAFWQQAFADLDQRPETREALNDAHSPMLTDAEIAALEREIEREGD